MATSCGFESHHRHQTNIIRTRFSELEKGSDYLFMCLSVHSPSNRGIATTSVRTGLAMTAFFQTPICREAEKSRYDHLLNCQLQTLSCRRTPIDKSRANVVHYIGTGKRPRRHPAQYPIRGHGGIGRLGGFRFHCESVQVRVLLPAPTKKSPLRALFCWSDSAAGLEPTSMQYPSGALPNAGWTAFAP